MKKKRKPSPKHITPAVFFNRVELAVRYGGGQPNAATHPDLDAEYARQYREAGERLMSLAMHYEASAAHKRSLVRFAMCPPSWHSPAPMPEDRPTSDPTGR